MQESRVLIDLDVLAIVPKRVRPLRFVATSLVSPFVFPRRSKVDSDLGPHTPSSRISSSQETFESRKLWNPLTEKMLAKAWGEASTEKQRIEQEQRNRTAQRKAAGEE